MADTIILSAGVEKKEIPPIHYFFSIIQGDEINGECDITDHFVENNSAVQDHVSLKPREFIVRGLIGEKVYNRDDLKYTGIVETALDKLGPVSAFLPKVSNYAQTVINATSYVESSAKRYVSTYEKVFKNKTQTVMQEKVYQTLEECRQNRTLMTLYIDNVSKFENLLIKSVRLTQDDSIYHSQLIVELKEYRSVSTQTTKADIDTYKSRCGLQKAQEENLGKVQGVNEELTSALYRGTYGAWGK